jgi:hypothetical protein
MAQNSLYSQMDCSDDSHELRLQLSEELLPEFHNENPVAHYKMETSNSCIAIETIKKLTLIHFENPIPFDWLHFAETSSLCLKCSLCMQSHKVIEET